MVVDLADANEQLAINSLLSQQTFTSPTALSKISQKWSARPVLHISSCRREPSDGMGTLLICVTLQKYQKDAIYRQMLEYKREKATLESQLKDIQKRSSDHDDHLRVVDAWWSQVNLHCSTDFRLLLTDVAIG
jgi:hypothetical protein